MAYMFDKNGNTINPAEEDGNLESIAHGIASIQTSSVDGSSSPIGTLSVSKRGDITAASVDISEAPYKHFIIWLNASSSSCAINFGAAAVIATTPNIDPSMGPLRFDFEVATSLYLIGASASGNYNLLAWN